MKQARQTLLLLFCFSLCSFVAIAVNLVPNPSFESTGTWSSWTYNGDAVINNHDSTEALFGNYSASIKDCTGSVIINRDGNPISPANDYVFSGWIKTEFETSDLKASLRLIWYRGANYLRVVDFGEVKGKTDWTFIYAEIKASEIPQEADRVTIACLVTGGSSTSKGTAYFDGLCLSAASSLERPQTPVLASSHHSGTVTLSWSEAGGAAEYFLYEGDSPQFKPSYSGFFGREQGRQYSFSDPARRGKYFWVVAVGANFVPSFFSNAVKGDSVAPLPVTDLAADDSQAGVVLLTWQVPQPAPDGELPAKYRIYKLTGPEFHPNYVIECVQLTAGDDGFSSVPGEVCEYWYPSSDGKTYYFVVTAIDDADNESTESNMVQGAPLIDTIPPNPPLAAEVFYTIGPEQEALPLGLVLLRWQEPQAPAPDGDHPRYYLIYRGVNSKALKVIGQKKAEQPGSILIYIDLTATEGCTYYYAIRSVDKARNESKQPELLVANPLPPPRARLLEPLAGATIIDKGEGGSLSLIWERVQPVADQVSRYIVEYAQDAGFRRQVFDLAVGPAQEGCLLSMSQLTDGVWYWRVKTEFVSGVVSYSEVGRFVLLKEQSAGSLKGVLSYVELEPKVLAGNNATNIFVALKVPAKMQIRIFDSRGRLVRELAESNYAAEVYTWQWDGRDRAGRKVPDGLYFVQIKAIAPPEPESTVVKRVQIFN